MQWINAVFRFFSTFSVFFRHSDLYDKKSMFFPSIVTYIECRCDYFIFLIKVYFFVSLSSMFAMTCVINVLNHPGRKLDRQEVRNILLDLGFWVLGYVSDGCSTTGHSSQATLCVWTITLFFFNLWILASSCRSIYIQINMFLCVSYFSNSCSHADHSSLEFGENSEHHPPPLHQTKWDCKFSADL